MELPVDRIIGFIETDFHETSVRVAAARNASSAGASMTRVVDQGVFDYVVVGAGAAGAIVASRLALQGKQVCLLEAGPADRHPWLHVPAGFIKMLGDSRYTWPFVGEPSPGMDRTGIALPQGRTLGGSTAINGMVYNRGQPEDYDEWAALGNPGWSYANVLGCFQRTESALGLGEDRFRGRQGGLKVTPNDWTHPVCEAFIEGAAELGIPKNPDYNGATQAGVGYYQRTIFKGWRMGAARAFLSPMRRHPNLQVRTGAHAVRIVCEDGSATGIEYMDAEDGGLRQRVGARAEVVVCAGAINTPKLLQLSGIGPAALLRDRQVPVVRVLEGVGENLRDHFAIRVVARVRDALTINELARAPRVWWEVAKWSLGRPSILAITPSVVHFHWRADGSAGRPDLQGVFSPASYRAGKVGVLDDYPGMSCGVWQHRPQSRGTVSIQSTDARQAPRIEPRYLTHPRDRAVMLAGLALARRLLQTRALARFYDAETLPGVDQQRDDELLDYIGKMGASSYHLNGTARMGLASDPQAVVDAELRVHGVGRLRVVDASVFPTTPSANICAATMMVAENGVNMLLAAGR